MSTWASWRNNLRNTFKNWNTLHQQFFPLITKHKHCRAIKQTVLNPYPSVSSAINTAPFTWYGVGGHHHVLHRRKQHDFKAVFSSLEKSIPLYLFYFWKKVGILLKAWDFFHSNKEEFLPRVFVQRINWNKIKSFLWNKFMWRTRMSKYHSAWIIKDCAHSSNTLV